MGQGLSCRTSEQKGFFRAVQLGDLETVDAVLERDFTFIHHATAYDHNSALHIAAANGQIQVLSLFLDRSVKPDLLNRHKQTPLMLAAMHGKVSCVTKLIEAGANFILSAARTSQVASSWGYSRFVNVRDGKGATPLHLAVRQRRPECVHMLLDNGAPVCASTSGYGIPGSTPLHLAARSGSLGCVRELLAWGADRLQTDSSGRISYTVALRHHHGACAALLNPSSAEPLVWPSPLKFISELNHEAKALLENALMEANTEREKAILKGTAYSLPSPSGSHYEIDNVSEASDMDLCCICFDQACNIEIQECGHQMCAQCMLALCCHNKPNPTTACPSVPICPFCRSNIVKLVVANGKTRNDKDNFANPQKSWRLRNSSEGSSSFKAISTVSSFGKMCLGSGRIMAENDRPDKPLSLDT
ncbi:putative E3 ubiquitin-protein ligase xbat31 [Orobanche minor]